jgi:hypothetical protein
MKELIKRILNEEFILNEFKINRKSLLHDLQLMDYSLEDAKDELQYHIDWFKSLPNQLILYRIIYIDGKDNINMKEPGSHYSMDKENLVNFHEYAIGIGDEKYLLTVVADKSLIDAQTTISNNILYPNEKEITLKKKGKGVKIIKIDNI